MVLHMDPQAAIDNNQDVITANKAHLQLQLAQLITLSPHSPALSALAQEIRPLQVYGLESYDQLVCGIPRPLDLVICAHQASLILDFVSDNQIVMHRVVMCCKSASWNHSQPHVRLILSYLKNNRFESIKHYNQLANF